MKTVLIKKLQVSKEEMKAMEVISSIVCSGTSCKICPLNMHNEPITNKQCMAIQIANNLLNSEVEIEVIE